MPVLKLLVACVVCVLCVLDRPHSLVFAEQPSDFAGKIFPTDRLDDNQVFGEVVVRQGDLLFVSGGLKGGKARVLVYRELSNDTASPLFRRLGDLVSDKESDGSGFGSSIAASKSFVAVGAPLDSATGFEAGKVFVYDTDVIAFLDSTATNITSQSTPTHPPPRPIVLAGSTSAFRERFGSSLSAGDDVIAVGAPASSFGSTYIFRRDSSLQLRWKLIGRLHSPFASSSSSLPSDRFGEKVQLVVTSSSSKGSADIIVAVGSPGFSSSPDSANSGAVFLYSYSTFVSSKPAQPILVDTIYDVTSSHSFFGYNFHFTSDVAFIAAVTPTLAGVVYYFEKDSVTASFVKKEILTSALPLHTSPPFSFTPSLPFLDGFGSSLVSIQATITVTRKHVSANHSLDNTSTPHRHNLRRLDGAEEDEDEDDEEEEQSADVFPSALPSSPPISSPSTTTVKSSSSEHVVSLLLVGAPSTSLIPRRSNGGKVEEGGLVYVFSNHRHVIRNLTCSPSSTSLTSSEIEVYFHSLCANTSLLGDWEVIDVFSADDIAQLPHAHYGSQLAADVTYSSSPSLLISAPFALPPSASSASRGSGLVYVSDNLRHTLSLLGDDVSKLLNGESSDSASQSPSSGADSGDDVFSVLWKALTSTDGVIVTATCLPALLIAALALYLYLRPPLVGGAVYSKMMSPTSSNTSKAMKRQSEEEGEKIRQLSYYHHLVHSLARSKPSLHTSSESNEEVSEAPPSKWRMWWHSKYDELNTASEVITSALPEDPSHLSPPRSSSSHSTSVKEEEVEEQIYDTSYPAADVISAKKKKIGGGATKWTSNPLHRETRHSQEEEEEGSAVTTSTSSFSTMTHFLGQWAPTLSTANERKAAEEVQALPR